MIDLSRAPKAVSQLLQDLARMAIEFEKPTTTQFIAENLIASSREGDKVRLTFKGSCGNPFTIDANPAHGAENVFRQYKAGWEATEREALGAAEDAANGESAPGAVGPDADANEADHNRFVPCLERFADLLFDHEYSGRSELVRCYLPGWNLEADCVVLNFRGPYGIPFTASLPRGPDGEPPNGDAIYAAYVEGASQGRRSSEWRHPVLVEKPGAT